MKVVIAYPPIDNIKGTPLLSQNRQYQVSPFSYFIYPVVPAYAATLLKQKGYEVYWLDGLAEKMTYEEWLEKVKEIQPDLIAIETKTPVIKYHWKIIHDTKYMIQNTKFVLMGDHVTAMPEESMKNCPVDFVITGGDYDFGLLSIADYLSGKSKLEEGIWFRNNSKRKSQNAKPKLKAKNYSCSGGFKLSHGLDELPMIDRDLTKWKLYACKNSNFYRAPGAYTMFGRDCWWGKCSFCVSGDTQIYTKNGLLPIDKIVNKKENVEVLTHRGRYREIIDWHKRRIDEEIINISPLYFPFNLELTKNHKIYCLPKENIKRCSHKNGWSYLCKTERISLFLNCDECEKKYFSNYALCEMEADKLQKGDFVAFPIDREVVDKKCVDIEKVLTQSPTVFLTRKKISDDLIRKIFDLHNKGVSQRKISGKLGIDRETVNRYIVLKRNHSLTEATNLLSYEGGEVSFKGGMHKVSQVIPLEKDFLFLVGLFLAEGHTSYSKNRPNSAVIGWTFSTKEKMLIEQTKLIFNKYFGISLIQTFNKKNKTEQLCIGSTIVARFFNILFGHDCYHKNIPFEFLRLPLDKQRYLLDGLFKGDGHLRKRENIKAGAEYILETTSKHLAEQAFLILLRFNAIPSFKVIPPNNQRESVKYKITLFHRDIIKVFPDIKFSIKKVTYKRGFILGDYALVPIVKLKRERFNDYVYNLAVDEDHSYVANFLTVKNCSWTTLFPGQKFRTMSVKKAIAEVENLVENYGVKEIMDDSGSFPVGDWLREFCEEIIKRGYQRKIKINCNMRFNSGLTQKDYDLIGRAGFRFILYGLESANQKTLDRLDKNLKVEQIESSLRMAKKASLWPHVTVMVGYPWEGEEEIAKTICFVKDLFKKGLVDTMQATIVIPYPGTPLFKECQKNNWLKTLDWNEYDMVGPVMKAGVSDERLLSSVRELYNNSIWNKTFVLNTIKQLKNWDGIKYVSFQGLKYLGKLVEFK